MVVMDIVMRWSCSLVIEKMQEQHRKCNLYYVVMKMRQKCEHSLIQIERSLSVEALMLLLWLFPSKSMLCWLLLKYESIVDHWDDWITFVCGMIIVVWVHHHHGFSSISLFVISRHWRSLISFVNDGLLWRKMMDVYDTSIFLSFLRIIVFSFVEL